MLMLMLALSHCTAYTHVEWTPDTLRMRHKAIVLCIAERLGLTVDEERLESSLSPEPTPQAKPKRTAGSKAKQTKPKRTKKNT